jgi:hypothetical protein
MDLEPARAGPLPRHGYGDRPPTAAKPDVVARGTMTERCAGPASQDRRQVPGSCRWGAMSQRINPAIKAVEPTGVYTSADPVLVQAEASELWHRHDPVLPGRQCRKSLAHGGSSMLVAI